MMRKRSLPKPQGWPEGRKIVSEFFGLEPSNIRDELQWENTFSINIKDNKEAQKKFKEISYNSGNTSSGKPGRYDFSDQLLVWWNGNKVQPL